LKPKAGAAKASLVSNAGTGVADYFSADEAAAGTGTGCYIDSRQPEPKNEHSGKLFKGWLGCQPAASSTEKCPFDYGKKDTAKVACDSTKTQSVYKSGFSHTWASSSPGAHCTPAYCSNCAGNAGCCPSGHRINYPVYTGCTGNKGIWGDQHGHCFNHFNLGCYNGEQTLVHSGPYGGLKMARGLKTLALVARSTSDSKIEFRLRGTFKFTYWWKPPLSSMPCEVPVDSGLQFSND